MVSSSNTLLACRQSRALSVECFMRHMTLAACTIPLLERIGRLQRLAKLHGQMQSQLQWQHAAAQVRLARLGFIEKTVSAVRGRAARPDRCAADVGVVGGLAATGSCRTSVVVGARCDWVSA